MAILKDPKLGFNSSKIRKKSERLVGAYGRSKVRIWPAEQSRERLFFEMQRYVLRVFPLCALVPRAQGSSGCCCHHAVCMARPR